MIWKNPFLAKNSEQQFRVEDFLALFDCSVLQMIEERNLSKVSYISSTPGAGKTSLFRAFSPQVLNEITSGQQDDEYQDIRKHMRRLGAIYDDAPVLLSANLSCARNYSIIDEMFQNGRRKQVFFALINYRVTISLIRAMGVLWNLDKEGYKRVTFVEVPQEMLSECSESVNAYELYEWACAGERELCRYLDSDRSEDLPISFVHTTLLTLKLFEPENILLDETDCCEYTLMIFDDFHKLSDNQKKYMSEALYTLKTNTGVWLGQRLEGVKPSQVISMDGSLNRDYNPNVVIDNYWPNKQGQFHNMLQNIANRRIQGSGYTKFSDCLSRDLSGNKYRKVLKNHIQSIREWIASDSERKAKYARIIEMIENSETRELMEKAVQYECIAIKERRNNSDQLSLPLGISENVEDFKAFVNKYKMAARFYVSIKHNIPFYYGMENLLMLSSYNVEQFLNFAGRYYDVYRIKSFQRNSGKMSRLTTEEQEEILEREARRRWEDMDLRYANIDLIKGFLNNVAAFCVDSRDAGRASYDGGAYTGFSVNNESLKIISEKPYYGRLLEVLGACLSSKYLEMRKNSGESVFYLNRWLCVYYKLPLLYGGYKRVTERYLLGICAEDERIMDSEQISMEL